MHSPVFGKLAGRVGIAVAAIALPLMAAAAVYADAPSPSTVGVNSQSGLSLTVSGTWTWPARATASTQPYVGYAIDWGDLTSGNQLGVYHIGDGTPATNVVQQPTSPDKGGSGTWGPASHTYASPGEYSVCVIFYDIGTTKPFLTSGYHSLKATGTSHNTDNSVEKNNNPSVGCTKIIVTDPTPSPTATPVVTFTLPPTTAPSATPTPFESFQGETATPFESFQGETAQPTPPPTGTDGGSTPGGSTTLPLIMLAIGALGAMAALARVKMERMR